jgi:hypothetical protein
MNLAHTHQAYHRELHKDVVRAARHRPLADNVEESRRDERSGYLARFRARRLRPVAAEG